jgi:fatty acyl-CoA reductase
MGMSSCVNLSRVAAAAAGRRPGFAGELGGRRGHGRSVLPVVAALPVRRKGSGCGVACCVSSSSSSSVHGKNSAAAAEGHAGGIGIAEFLGGKNFLITGGTGFLAKGSKSIFFLS